MLGIASKAAISSLTFRKYNMKHKHAELIHAWADGAEIEYFSGTFGKWLPVKVPFWEFDTRYRIKPQPVEMWQFAYKETHSCTGISDGHFTSEEKLKEKYKHFNFEWIQKLDHTKIVSVAD